MSLHLPHTATADDVDALDGVSRALRAAGAAVDAARAGLLTGLAHSGWTGQAAAAARARGRAEGETLAALTAQLTTTAALVAALRGSVAHEAAVVDGLERTARELLDRLTDLPGGLADALRRASGLGGWAGPLWRGIPLPPGGSAAWHEASGLIRRLVP